MAIDRKVNTHKKQFDLKTHIRDGKGNIKTSNPYRATIINGVKEFERPPGSGFVYTEGGDLIRSPKGNEQTTSVAKEEFSNEELKKQLEALKVQIALKDAPLEEINMTAKDVDVSDVPAIPAQEVDNSEEIALMENAGAIEEAAKLKAAKFNKPNFMK